MARPMLRPVFMVTRIALAAVLVAGWLGTELQADPATPAQPSLAEALQATQVRMHQRYAALRTMEQAIVASDLPQIRATARVIVELDEPAILPSWKPYIDGVRAAARDVSEAKDIASAARLSAQVGKHCAECHASIRAQIPLPHETPPATDAHLATRMTSHQWAAARMWEGLIVPSDARWKLGAHTLATAPLAITAESERLGIADDVAKVRLLATRAQKPGADRATIYGDLLAVCAHCHAVIRDR